MNPRFLFNILTSLFLLGLLMGCSEFDCPVPTKYETTTLKPDESGKDAVVDNFVPVNNFGAHDFIYANAWTISSSPVVWRSLIQFNLSSLPPGSKISKATLKLFGDVTGMVGGHSTLTGGNEIRIKRITSPWNESTVTWNNQPVTDDVNQITVPSTTSIDQNIEVDVTTLIKEEYENPTLYHGLLLQLVTEIEYRAVSFASSDNPDPLKWPELKLDYSY